ncbi:MAG: 2-oxoacid:acceptor oxidoreductase subunit alpha, partial [Nitrospirae bacterium]
NSSIYENTVAVGAVLGMLGMDLEVYERVIERVFLKKKPEVVEINKKAARAGYSYAKEKCLACKFVVPKAEKKNTILINGNQAIGLGALVSGLRFYSAYPMTPSTGIMNYIASRAEEFGVVVEQAEDEIAAINMALGASFAGVRAMTGSSGGGFALMVEGVSLAGMTETPIVIAEVQRPGPATGLPTRTEQADLLFVLYAGHGEFPKVVFAPGTPEECFYLTNLAFDITERFQVPVFILSDQYLADSQWSIPEFDKNKLIYRDYRIKDAPSQYRRHAITNSGISPLAIPGEGQYLVVTDSDEHDEEGHIIEDAETRIKMVQKRLHMKLPQLKEEALEPKYLGPERPDVVLLCWGSTYGVVREVSEATGTGMLHFSQVWPIALKDNWLSILREARKVIAVEQNATGQFARLLRSETSFQVDEIITKYDGRPFLYEELLEEVKKRI